MKKFIVVLLLLISSNFALAQDDLFVYKKLFKVADSLNKVKQPILVNSEFKNLLDSHTQLHPSEFFKSSGVLLSDMKLNEAGFIYYLGLLRYRYYNAANPNYQPGNDGALLGSFKAILGAPIDMYLRTNIENYISILKNVKNYDSLNEYIYFPRNKNIDKYTEQKNGITNLIIELQSNKLKYTNQWNSERLAFQENIDVIIQQLETNKTNSKKTKKNKDRK